MPLAPTIGTHLTEPAFGQDRLRPIYRVQAFAFDPDTFGIGSLIADFPVALNVGWGKRINEPPEFFFTLHQDEPSTEVLSSVLGRAHIRILRGDRIVSAGWLMESDETNDDVVFYGYGYLAGFYWLLSEWKHQFQGVGVSEIVRLLWRRAITFTYSMLAFVATGSIEGAVLGDSDGQIVLPDYTVYYKRLLYCFQELAALGTSDTEHNVVFEITDEEVPRFNFWSNAGIARPDVRIDESMISGFRRARTPVFHRNNVQAVGSLAFDVLNRKEEESETAMAFNGRRQEPLFLAWVRDETEMDRVVKHRMKAALREDTELHLSLYANSLVPPGGLGSRFDLADTLPVKIDHGATHIDDRLMVSGVQVIFDGDEHVRLILQDKRRDSPAPVGERYVIDEPNIDSSVSYVAFPGLDRLADGRLVVTYRRATDHATTYDGIAVARISADEGRTWGSPITIFNHATLDIRGVEVLVTSAGTAIASFDTWNGGRDNGGIPGPLHAWVPHVSRSTDNGATWGTPIQIAHDFDLFAVGHASRIVQLDDGTLLYPLYGQDVIGQDRFCAVIRSTDDGLTWGNQSLVAQVPGEHLDEPNITVLDNGELLCLMRGSTSQMYQASRSSDNGYTWTTPVALFAGNGKPSAMQLDSGKLLFVGRGSAVSPAPEGRDNEWRVSLDRGRTWTGPQVLDARGDVALYSSVLPTGGDTALVAYGVEWSDTRGAIYIARFA